jgi:hypothetical protein
MPWDARERTGRETLHFVVSELDRASLVGADDGADPGLRQASITLWFAGGQSLVLTNAWNCESSEGGVHCIPVAGEVVVSRFDGERWLGQRIHSPALFDFIQTGWREHTSMGTPDQRDAAVQSIRTGD